MVSILSGPGVGLQLPQNLYPSELYNAPYDFSTNYQSLAGGDALTIPAGGWWVDPGSVGVIQYSDPVTGIWRGLASGRGQPQLVISDGFSWRIANLTGCPVAAIVVVGGSGYPTTAGGVTITPSAGNSTWTAIVGGQCSVVTVGSTGSGYGVAPLVLIPAPPSPGVAATAYASISAGTVSGVTLSNVGAGYTTAPVAAIVPSPFDPNFSSVTAASVTLGLVGAGSISAVLCTNPGAPLTSLTGLTLTAAGATGSGASISAVVMQTVTALVAVGAGGGYSGTAAEIVTIGGVPPGVPQWTNPEIEPTAYRPRPANIGVTVASGTITAGSGVIYDGGLFLGTPSSAIIGLGVLTTASLVTLTMGSAATNVLLQPLKV